GFWWCLRLDWRRRHCLCCLRLYLHLHL
ncbi:hypothetical protein, partial [uncultured Gammaproteobacteria bacterium]